LEKRRSLGVPGLMSRIPFLRSTRALWVWPKTTASTPRNLESTRLSIPMGGPQPWVSPMRFPSTSSTLLSGSTAFTSGRSMLPHTAATGATERSSSRMAISTRSPACSIMSAPSRPFSSPPGRPEATLGIWVSEIIAILAISRLYPFPLFQFSISPCLIYYK